MRAMAFRRICLMALAAMAIAADAAAYELRFNDGHGPACTACWAVPASERTYSVDCGGFIQQVLCERDPKDGTMRLRGLEAWGTVEKDVLTLTVTRKDFEGTYRFKGGRLKSFSRPGAAGSEAAERMRARLTSSASPEALRNALWRRRKPETRCRYWDRCNDRLRLWFENPNEAGALLALIALLVLGCALSLHGIWRLHAILLTPTCFCGVLLAESRGAVLAYALGAVAMIACWCWRRRSVRQICLYGLSVILAAGIVYLLFGKTRCISRLLELDVGNSMRLDMWLAAPRMMVCAPLGWWSKVGSLYCEWFQFLGINQVFWSLNNTHLTVMVWGGFVVSFVYVWLWVEILRSLTAEALWRGRILALGQWVALAVAMWFSPIGLYHPDVLVLPGLLLALHVWRLASERRFSLKGIGGSALVAACLLLLVAFAGWLLQRDDASGSHLVVRKAFGIQLGRGEPKTWIVNDGFVLSGGTCGVLGKELRAFLRQHPDRGALAVVDSLDALPARAEKAILTGSACSEYVRRYRDGESVPEARQLYFLSPDLQPSEIPSELTDGNKLRVVAGEVLVSTWGRLAFVPSWLTIVPATALYIPGWKECVGL